MIICTYSIFLFYFNSHLNQNILLLIVVKFYTYTQVVQNSIGSKYIQFSFERNLTGKLEKPLSY